MDNVRLIAFDLDGTLTQHKTKLAQPNLGVLNALRAKYKLLMVGAGMCSRIFSQMNGYPIDIIGNYGMQFCTCRQCGGKPAGILPPGYETRELPFGSPLFIVENPLDFNERIETSQLLD